MPPSTPVEDAAPEAPTPWVAVTLVVLSQHLALLPVAFYGARSPPALVDSLTDAVHMVRQGFVTLGYAGLLLSGLLLLLSGRSRSAARWGSTAVLFAHGVMFGVFIFHFLKLGAYPGFLALEDLWADPGFVIGYIGVGMSGFDRLIVVVSLLLQGVIAWMAARNIPFERVGSWRPMAGLGAAALAVGLMLGVVPGTQALGTRAESSLPTYYVIMRLHTTLISGDRGLRVAGSYVPPVVAQPLAETERPQHVVVVIADSLRADALPFGGYERNTMPTLWANREDWTAYEQVYSPGAGTRASLPVIFSSTYLAELEVKGDNARRFWQTLSSAGYQTALLSGSTLDWAYIDVKSALTEVDHYQTAADSIGHHDGTEDAAMVEAYATLLDATPEGKRTVTFVYLLSTHFPYYVPDEFGRYTPNLHSVQDAYNLDAYTTNVGAETVRNSYDNGTLYVDHNVTRLLEILDERGVLAESVVMVTSDHGEALGEHGHMSHGASLFEEQVRVPMLVRVGEDLPELGAALEAAKGRMVGLVDLAPTLVSMTGAQVPPTFQGMSWLGTEEKPWEVMVCRHIRDKVAVVRGQKKYWLDVPSLVAHAYDLSTDPGELNNTWTEPVGSVADFFEVLEEQGVVEASHPPR